MATTQTRKDTSAVPEIEIGIDANARKSLADGLSHMLADTYTLYVKTHNFHWNVTGPMFQTLHLMFNTVPSPKGRTRSPSAFARLGTRRRAAFFSSPS